MRLPRFFAVANRVDRSRKKPQTLLVNMRAITGARSLYSYRNTWSTLGTVR